MNNNEDKPKGVIRSLSARLSSNNTDSEYCIITKHRHYFAVTIKILGKLYE